MKYKILVKQIEVVDVNAYSYEQAVELIKRELGPKVIAEFQLVEEATFTK